MNIADRVNALAGRQRFWLRQILGRINERAFFAENT